MQINDIKYDRDIFSFAYRVSAIIYNKDKTKILLFYGNDMDYYMLPGGKVHQLEKSEDEISKEPFKSIESDWINFKWVDINELDNYKIHPSNVKELIKNSNSINHLVEIVNK